MPRTLTPLVPALLALACAPIAPDRAPARRPDVFLLTLDTFRRDAFGALTEERPSSTPHLDGLAAGSVLFTTAYAPMPFTLPSHMSLLTGVYPDAHGVAEEGRALGPNLPTLAEILRREGYGTQAVVTSGWLDAAFGFDRGFDAYQRLPPRLSSATRVTDAALEIVDRTSGPEVGASPLFLWLHYFEAHSDFRALDNRWPYYAPPRHRPAGADGDGSSWCTREDVCATGFLDSLNRRRRRLPPDRLAMLRALYDGGVRALDEELGRLVDGLRRRGRLDGALLVITADHGEELQEHGQFLHAQPYDETVVVPLLLKRPGETGPGSRLDDPVALVDVLPTVLELLALEPPAHAQGRSLLPLLEDEGTEESVLSQDKLRRQRYALRRGRWKLILDIASGDAELYDLLADPAERHDLAADRPATVARLRRYLASTLTASRRLAETLGARDGTSLSPADREELRALGYLD